MSYWTNDVHSNSTLLLLHGFRGNHKGLSEFSRSFSTQKVLMLDLPGYGHSECFDDTHNFKTYAHFLHHFIEAAKLTRVTVIGHSFGASVAIVFAALYPKHIQKLILIAPVTYAHTLEATLGKAYYKIGTLLPASLRSSWIKSHLIDYLSYMILLKNSAPRRYQRLILASKRNIKDLNERVVTENFQSFYSLDLYRCAKNIQIPTLIVFGDADHISPLSSMLKLNRKIAGSKISIIPKAGHLVPLEQPYTVGHIVENFLQGKNA